MTILRIVHTGIGKSVLKNDYSPITTPTLTVGIHDSSACGCFHRLTETVTTSAIPIFACVKTPLMTLAGNAVTLSNCEHIGIHREINRINYPTVALCLW